MTVQSTLAARRVRHSSPARCAAKRAANAILDALESRRLLAANDPLTINTFKNGTETWLNITGTATADTIVVTRASATGYRITNGTWTATRTGTWAGVRVAAGADDDTIAMLGTIATRAWFLGEAGNDSILGGIGNDMLFGGAGDDSIRGGNGNDQVRGEAGVDTLFGDAGNDNMFGGTEADSISGDFGNDSILGDAGADTIAGGEGNDTVLAGPDADSVAGGNGNDLLRGEAGNDTLLGEAGNDILQGTGDADSLVGGVGNDSMLGEAGNDTLVGEAGNDTLNGGLGDDSINGGADNDSLLGDADNDTLIGEAGIDLLNGGLGNDSVDAGDGNDKVMGDAGTDTYVGGAGTDSLDYFGRTVAISISLDGQANDGATGENDDFGDGFEIFVGGNVADSITGSEGNDQLFGGSGNDTIDGGDGNDKIVGGAGADSLSGGAGNDSVYGQADNDKLFGNVGEDLLEGGAGNDASDGGADRDRLIAIGGGAFDSVTGGDGLDSFWLDADSTEKLLDLSSEETAAKATHRVKSFVNYGTTAISKEISGQKFIEPVKYDNTATKLGNFANYKLFADGGPTADDVSQGGVGDCWYLAALASLADTMPEVIRQAITDLGDGTFAVRFRNAANTADQYVRIDGDLHTYSWNTAAPIYADLGAQNSTWVALMEKALTWVRGAKLGTYGTINGGWMSEAYTRSGVPSVGRFPGQFLSSSVMGDWIKQQLLAGKAMTVGFNGIAPNLNLVSNHAYTIDRVEDHGDGTLDVILRNPWGIDNYSSIDGSNDGYIKLTMAQLMANYSGMAAAA